MSIASDLADTDTAWATIVARSVTLRAAGYPMHIFGKTIVSKAAQLGDDVHRTLERDASTVVSGPPERRAFADIATP